MNKIFNSIHLLEQNEWLTPWKFIFNYRYKSSYAIDNIAFVSVIGTTDSNERIELFKYEILRRQPDETSDAYVTHSIINAIDKRLVDINIEILNYEYIELKGISFVARPKNLPVSNNIGDILDEPVISVNAGLATITSDNSIKYFIQTGSADNDYVYKNGTDYTVPVVVSVGDVVSSISYNTTAISGVVIETIV